jgi:hypothetical protein
MPFLVCALALAGGAVDCSGSLTMAVQRLKLSRGVSNAWGRDELAAAASPVRIKVG